MYFMTSSVAPVRRQPPFPRSEKARRSSLRVGRSLECPDVELRHPHQGVQDALPPAASMTARPSPRSRTERPRIDTRRGLFRFRGGRTARAGPPTPDGVSSTGLAPPSELRESHAEEP